MNKFYDKKNRRLIIFQEKASSEFWDRHWQLGNFDKKVVKGKENRFIKKITNQFLFPGQKILEGGCGIGQNVYGLNCWGYDVYGVDFAKDTIHMCISVKSATHSVLNLPLFPQFKFSKELIKKW